MKFNKLKTINKASERDMLNHILATQKLIFRKLDFLESKITDEDVKPYNEATKEFVNGIDSSLDRINDFLKLSDSDKGQLII